MSLQQRIAKKLEAKGKGGAITNQVHSLSATYSREKIAAFKAKMLAKKRGTIKSGDDIAGVVRKGEEEGGEGEKL